MDWKQLIVRYRPYLLAVIFAVLFTYFVRPMVADGDAMIPNVEEGQVIIVYKDTYNRSSRQPSFGDLVVFRKDFYPAENKGENTLRRAIGVPGDTIEIKDGNVIRNGEILNEPYAIGMIEEDMPPVEVELWEVFVLSDNRENGIDSRHSDVGVLRVEDLRGKAWIRIWPLNQFGFMKAEGI